MFSRSNSESNIANRLSSRSESFESLPCSGDNETLAEELLAKIQTSVIIKLKKYFFYRLSKSERESKLRLDRKLESTLQDAASKEGIDFSQIPSNTDGKVLWIDRENFILAIENIFGGPKFRPHSDDLFTQLDPFHTGKIWWSELLDRLVDHGAKRTRNRSQTWTPTNETVLIKQMRHCKNSSIVKVVHIQIKNTFCYAFVAKNGKVGLYDGKTTTNDKIFKVPEINTQFKGKAYELSKGDGTFLSKAMPISEYDIFSERNKMCRLKKSVWITDCIFLEDCRIVVMASSDRSLTFFDSSSVAHYPIYLISSVPNIPTCLAYGKAKSRGDFSRLFFGDDHGGITVMNFKQARVSLFQRKNLEKMNSFHWTELFSQESHISIYTWPKVHTRSVSRIFYDEKSEAVLSCSNDGESSIVLRSRSDKHNECIFHVKRGVTCFHFSRNILAAGSRDGILRLFDPLLTCKPFAVLENQVRTSIIDVAVVAHFDIVIGLHKNLIVNIWDIYDECCLQTVILRFPFVGVLGRKIEFGINSIYPGPPRSSRTSTDNTERPRSRSASRRTVTDEYGMNIETVSELGMNNDSCADRAKYLEINKWKKTEIFITCCDHIAILNFNPERKESKWKLSKPDKSESYCEDTESVLPPPDKSFQVRRPSVWNLDDFETACKVEDTDDSKSLSGDMKLNMTLDIPRNVRPYDSKLDRTIDYELVNLLKKMGLSDLMRKDYTKVFNLNSDLSLKMSQLKSKENKMKTPVSMCAPYMALELHELDKIIFLKPIPVTSRMKKKSGLENFSEASNMLEYSSCFSMSSPRSIYSTSTTKSGTTGLHYNSSM